ncbi:MAG: CRTAC1 family protein [Planctomycetota bacterium]
MSPLVLAIASLLSPTPSDPLFVEVGALRGLEPYVLGGGMASGLAAQDFDDDGDVDLFVPNGLGATDQLYVNDGSGQFVESAAALGLAIDGNHRGALWFDADGDSDLDLLVAGDCFEDVPCGTGSTLRLHEQLADGTFREVTLAAGLGRNLSFRSDAHVGGLSAGDIDGDGDLDLLVAMWEGLAHLYVNDGTGRFVDRGRDAGLQVFRDHWQPVMFDFDADGRLDVFQAVDFGANMLWMNQGDGTFVDAAPSAGVDTAFNEMGVSLADFDRDGDLDLYVTNIFTPTGRHNVLFARRGTELRFDEVSGQFGVRDSGCGWGNSFFDADLDGWMDLVASNSCAFGSTRFFYSRVGEGGGFEDVTVRVGLDGFDGTGTVTFDMDGDGDRDIAQVGAAGIRLFENRLAPGTDRHFLVVRPRLQGGRARAISASVTVFDGVHHTTRAILAGSSTLSQEPAEAHFGLDDVTSVDVSVRWPDGSVTTLVDVAADQVLDVVAP